MEIGKIMPAMGGGKPDDGPRGEGRARAHARHASLVTPSCPDDTLALVGTSAPAVAAARLRELGAAAVAVTMGSRGLHVVTCGETKHLPPASPPRIVDTTGAGDVLAGTAAARLALGDQLLDALRHAVGAAAQSLAGPAARGGSRPLPKLPPWTSSWRVTSASSPSSSR